ncbi:MAG TPA: glycosyltransferase family 39 protein [Candidatus Binataceae bacterium]|nr:glycosyltransferase family 39 protein [Candidatus Binataceae bacterium]
MVVAVELKQRLWRPSPWRARWAAAGVMVGAAALFLARLGARALWSSEGRWAEIVREMRLTGNYFWPTINGHLYFDKPLLSYWLILAATPLTGGASETAARIPSALAGWLGVVVLMVLGRRLYDRGTAAVAGLILATSYSYVFFSRHAAADVETVTGTLAAIWLFAAGWPRPQGWWLMLFWPVMALTSLTKGLIGFALPLAVCGSYSIIEPGSAELRRHLGQGSAVARLRWLSGRLRWLFNLKSVLAIALGLLIYWLPFAASQARSHSDAGIYMVFRENLVRYFAPFDHRGPIYLYVEAIFVLMAPWALFLPAALVQRHRRLAEQPIRGGIKSELFVLTYFWATFIFFTLSRSRRSYYLLPILPAAALLVARTLRDYADSMVPMARRLMQLGFAILMLGVVIGGIGYLLPPSWRVGSLRLLPASPDRALFAILWLIALAVAVGASLKCEPRRVALATGVIAYAGMFFLFVFAMPAAEPYRTERAFARAVRVEVGSQAPADLALYRLWGPGLVYYLAMPKPIPQFDNPAALQAYARARGGLWVITRGLDRAAVGGRVVLREPLMAWDPPSEARGRYLLLHLP